MEPLRGEELLVEIRSQSGRSRAEILRATGYSQRSETGAERQNTSGFLSALFEALQSQTPTTGDFLIRETSAVEPSITTESTTATELGPEPTSPREGRGDPMDLQTQEQTANEPRRAYNNIGESLVKTVIAIPLLRQINAELEQLKRQSQGDSAPRIYDVIIDLNQTYAEGRTAARERVKKMIVELLAMRTEQEQFLKESIDWKSSSEANRPLREESRQYVFAHLTGETIRRLVIHDGRDDSAALAVPKGAGGGRGPIPMPKSRAIFQIWEDFEVHPLIYATVSTVKADAARFSFGARGAEIVWAVIDSGIDHSHPHFRIHKNLEVPDSQWHRDFTGENAPFTDGFGHGTHVAGIIAGEIPNASTADLTDHPEWAEDNPQIHAYMRSIRSDGDGEAIQTNCEPLPLPSISGIAPKAKLVSLKVLNSEERGKVSNILNALAHIQEINTNGRYLRIHGVNLSVGYPFDPEWFACGQSQICVEVNRLVRSGVVVVVAAGNTGNLGGNLSIMDPGNAELAITVGATHRTMPYVYGVSYFSSRGPTGDGRAKPDLLAPGEKVVSCGAMDSNMVRRILKEYERPGMKKPETINYIEDSGTSMAAPHVSGAAAALLSIKREFIGQPERVKEIFMQSASDLGRERAFQGAGLIDMMRAIQSV